MSVTISDVARIANVSKAAVSAVLNNKPGVSLKTRERILEVINKLNYRPNMIARSLSAKETKSIGLVIKEIDNPFFAKVTKGVFDQCFDLGYMVLLGSSELSPEKERKSIETLVNQRVDGLILSPLQGDDVDFTYLSDLIKEKYPLVTLGHVTNFQTNVVDIDNVQAALTAVSHLIEKGHIRIGYFSGPSYSAHSRDRMNGYRQAFSNHNLPVDDSLVFSVGSYIEDGYEMGKKIFANKSDYPTAIFCYNDLVAIGLLNALHELNYKVPEDVSIVGFDNIDFCKSVVVPLTTIKVPAYKIGQAAARLVIEQIATQSHPQNKKMILPAELIIRSSVS